MSKLDNYANIYVDLSSGAYGDKPRGKSFVDKTYDQQRELSDKGYATYSFESNLGLYYLQPDKLETVTEKDCFGNEKISQKIL